MGAFTIAYVPTVEEVQMVDKVNIVENVENVDVVQDVKKFPHPYFPLKKYNYQKGGRVHVISNTGMFQAVYIPEHDMEVKGIHLSFTSYNIDDTYDIMLGSRYILKDSYVKEMTEYRMFEVYETVNAGTPIIINFYNNSGLEKYLMYEIITVIDEQVISETDSFYWTLDWEDENYELGEQDYLTLVVSQPNYVNMESVIDTFSLSIIDITLSSVNALITFDGTDISTDYVETEPEYISEGFLARVNVIAITSVVRYDKSIAITFKNISNTDPHPVEIQVIGTVNNSVE
jgi:hypothetical protein